MNARENCFNSLKKWREEVQKEYEKTQKEKKDEKEYEKNQKEKKDEKEYEKNQKEKKDEKEYENTGKSKRKRMKKPRTELERVKSDGDIAKLATFPDYYKRADYFRNLADMTRGTKSKNYTDQAIQFMDLARHRGTLSHSDSKLIMLCGTSLQNFHDLNSLYCPVRRNSLPD